MTKRTGLFVGGAAAVAMLAAVLTGCTTPKPEPGRPPGGAARSPGFLLRTNYHGWTNAVWVSNGYVEAIVVPEIGRIMQFRFAGETNSPFWENPGAAGRLVKSNDTEWVNFGGERIWPAPQSQWLGVTGRGWPPPYTFDGAPFKLEVDGWRITLTSGVDPHYGVRLRREIEFEIDRPVMHVTTIVQKIRGVTVPLSIWDIAQLREPLALFAPVSKSSRYLDGYSRQSEQLPPDLVLTDGVLRLTRDPKTAHKIGLDAGTLLWMSEDTVLRIDMPRLPYREYPDAGSSTEIYTHPDPLPYVELEFLGQMRSLRIGEKTFVRATFTLERRQEIDPVLEARRQFLR